ncbi:MAG: alpha/beta hydrolase-fold protein [Bacteroidota bacterium]
MKTTKLFILISLSSLNIVFAQENSINNGSPTLEFLEHKTYQMPRTQVIQVSNSETDTLNTLYIKLPKGYEENTDLKYPVIYFTHPVHHIEILSSTAYWQIEDVILVGITWQKGLNLDKLDSYLNFIHNDVFKTIESNYRADADQRTYYGYSYGAVVGAYFLTEHPNTFENYILGSPALGIDHQVINNIYALKSTEMEDGKKLNANVFVSYGNLETTAIPLFEKFITMLKGLNDGTLTLKHTVVEGDHSTALPMTTVRSMYWLSELIKD